MNGKRPRTHLVTHERNLLYYLLTHMKRSPNAPCFVPRPTANHLDTHLGALHHLEKSGYITLIKTGDHYAQWIMKLRKTDLLEGKQEEFTPDFNASTK